MNTTLHAFLIEDDAHSLVAIGSLLDELGIAYKRNTTGANVALQLQDMQPRPDFILLNLDLPEGDAFAICRELRASPCTQAIPIIALTAHTIAGDREKTLAAGCDDYSTKPVDFPQLLTKIQALLKMEAA